MKFISNEHKQFCPDIRLHIHDIFDFKDDHIKLSCLEKGWQTSGSHKTCLMAFECGMALTKKMKLLLIIYSIVSTRLISLKR